MINFVIYVESRRREIFQQVYNFVDAAVVGRFVSAEALAAVGATGTLMSIACCLIMGLTNGAGIILSQCLGARNYDELRKTVTGSVLSVKPSLMIIPPTN